MPTGPARERGGRPPPPRPVERLLLARPVRRHLHLATCASRRYEHLIAAEDARGPRARDRSARRELRDLDLDGRDEVLARPTTGQVVAVKPGEGGGIGGVGPPGGPPRARRRAPPPARGVPRDAARARGRRDDGRAPTRAAEPATPTARTATAARRVDPRPRHGQGGGPRRRACSTTTTSGARAWSGSSPRTRRPRRSRRPRRPSSATCATASSPSTTSRPARSRCRATAGSHGQPVTVEQDDPPRSATGWRPSSSSSSSSTTAGRRADRRRGWASSCRSTCWAAAATRRPGTTSAATGSAHDGSGQADGHRRDRLRQRLGRASRSRPRPEPAGGRLVEPDRDRLQLRGRLRARLPGQRPAALVAARGWRRARRAGSRCARPVSVARDRAAEEARGARVSRRSRRQR